MMDMDIHSVVSFFNMEMGKYDDDEEEGDVEGGQEALAWCERTPEHRHLKCIIHIKSNLLIIQSIICLCYDESE